MNRETVILVVDDNRDNLLMFSDMLNMEGYSVCLASSGLLALELARSKSPDLILLDIVMPDMDGFEVCRNLKMDPLFKNIPVIFLSGLDSTSQKVQAFREGAVDYITKPFHTEEVLARVRTHLQLVQQAELEALHAELQQAHDAQRLQLDRYTALFDFAPVSYISLDSEGHILNINLAGAALVGVARSRINKRVFANFVAEEDQPILADFLKKVFNPLAGRSSCELRLAKDGGRRTVFVQIEALAKGSGLECLLAVTDVTGLRLEEQKFRIVADNTYDWEFWISPQNVFIYNSPSCLRITGYDPALFYKDPAFFARIIHPDDRDIFNRHRRDFASACLEDEVDFRIIRADGEIRWIYHACRPVYDQKEVFLGTRGSNRDITDRKQAEKILVDSEHRFRTLFDGMNEGVALHSFLYDDSGVIINYRIVSVNPACEKILGLQKDMMIGKTGNEAYGTADPPYLKEFSSVIASQSGFSFETSFPPMKKHFNISVIPWESTGFATIFTDITERKRTEQQLKQFNRSLEERITQAVDDMRQKDQMLILQERRAVMGEMINNIAHQWRQPLNALALNLQELPYAYDAPEFSREYLKNSVESSMQLIEHMSQTIDDFRNFFRLDKKNAAFSVNSVIRRTISIIEKSFLDHQVRIVFKAKGDPVVNGYANEYSQALLNIIINARDALVARQVEDARITVQGFADGDKTVVTITDNAGGIAEEIIERVFDPYFTTKGPDKGTGIGLFMSMIIIEKNMGGRLTVTNTGSGAEFRIEV